MGDIPAKISVQSGRDKIIWRDKINLNKPKPKPKKSGDPGIFLEWKSYYCCELGTRAKEREEERIMPSLMAKLLAGWRTLSALCSEPILHTCRIDPVFDIRTEFSHLVVVFIGDSKYHVHSHTLRT